jgi:hypothetical protein
MFDKVYRVNDNYKSLFLKHPTPMAMNSSWSLCNGNTLYECDELSIVLMNQFYQIYEYSIEIILYNVYLINGLLY